MNSRLQQLYKGMRDLFGTAVESTEMADPEVKREGLEGYVDAAYALRKMEDMCDEVRKTLKRKREMYERVCCLGWMQRNSGEPLRTEYVTATPDMKQFSTYPKHPKDAGYWDMMKSLGVDPRTIELGVLRPDFNSCKEYVTALTAAGEPLPGWADSEQPHTEYRLRFHPRRKEIDAS